MNRRLWVLAGAAAGIAVAVGVWLAVGLNSSGGTTPQLDHVGYARLWTRTAVGDRLDVVLSEWPKPYQTYSDGTKNQCFEWWDKPISLYNLCFNKGVLVAKSLA